MTARRSSGQSRRTLRRIAASLATWVLLAIGSAPASPAAAVASKTPAASAEALYQEATARLATRRTADLEASLNLFS